LNILGWSQWDKGQDHLEVMSCFKNKVKMALRRGIFVMGVETKVFFYRDVRKDINEMKSKLVIDKIESRNSLQGS
jgi:hypothetical protein